MGNYTRNTRSRRDSGVEMHSAVCDKCGKSCKVPFKPSGEKPIFCSDCFEKKETNRSGGGRRNDRGRRDDRRRDSRSRDSARFGATCAKCGETFSLPFEPRTDKPVYCDSCFTTQKSTGSSESMEKIEAQLLEINEKLDVVLKALKPIVPKLDPEGEVTFREKKAVRTVESEPISLD